MRRPARTATAIAAALLLAAGGLVAAPSPASAAVTSYIRVNQVGYPADQPKIAYLLGTSGQARAAFRVVDASGATVHTGQAGASRGGWNTAYTGVVPVDFSALTTPGRYTIQITGATTSPTFEIKSRAGLYAPVASTMTRFFQANRDGAAVIPGPLNRKPAHLNDASATVYEKPVFVDEDDGDTFTGGLTAAANTAAVDVSGGWFDAGDYLKFTHTTAYAVGALLVAERSGSADTARAAEIDHAMSWLDRMWDERTGVLYAQVGIGGDNETGTIKGDHSFWRLPETDDTGAGATRQFLRHRPVFRANAPGAPLSPNLAGRVSAAFALAAQVHATSDPARARDELATAAAIYAKAQTTNVNGLVTAYPSSYYPETVWQDDMTYGATELARAGRALGDGRAGTWLTQAAQWARAYLDSDAANTLNLYDVGGIALPDLAEAITAAGASGLPVTRASLLAQQKAQLDAAVRVAEADRFRAAADYAYYDSTSFTLGLIAQSVRYDEASGTSTYAQFAQSQASWALGGNPWGVSLIVGVGSTFPKCPHHQIADLAGSHNGSGAILAGAAVNGPNAAEFFDDLVPAGTCGTDVYPAFTGNGSRFMDDTEAWMSNEPAIDFTSTGLLAFALLGKGAGGTVPRTPAEIAAANGFYPDPDSNPMRWVAANPTDARTPAIRDNLATKAGARWFGDWSGDIRAATDAYLDAATAAGKVPILTAYNIPQRDCDGQSTGGAADAAAYRQWITEFAAGVAGRPAIVIIEPDAVAKLDCLSQAAIAERFLLIEDALAAFGGQAWTYVDAGNAGFVAADVMAERFNHIDLGRAHGVSINVSNFWTTAESTAYAEAMKTDMDEPKPYVIDTSRNGNGHKQLWCNPVGVKLGATSRLSASGAEMLLWIKVPGDSDGDCGRIEGEGVYAGTFDPRLATWLINGS